MVIFSVGGEDESEGGGPSHRAPKRQRVSEHQRELLLFEESRQQHNSRDEEEVDEPYGLPRYDQEREEQQQEEDSYRPVDEEDNQLEEEEDQQEDGEEDQHDVYSRERSEEEDEVEQQPFNSCEIVSAAFGVSVTLTDPDVLDCSICYDCLKIPVFQCENGHIACSSCCIKVKNKCPSCAWPIGYNRCRAIEKVIECVRMSCENTKFGCKEQVIYNKKKDHEDTCIFAPSSCPLSCCSFVGSSNQLSQHFSTEHSISTQRFRYSYPLNISLVHDCESLILQEENEGVLYILSNRLEDLGNVVTISCIAPKSSKRQFSYELIVKEVGFSLRLHLYGHAENIPPSPSRFLLIPRGVFCPTAPLSVTINHLSGNLRL